MKCRFFLFILLFFLNSLGNRWVHPVKNGIPTPTTYLFAPGLFQSEVAISRYCTVYAASTGELFTCAHQFAVINPLYCYSCNFSEIKPHYDKNKCDDFLLSWWSFCLSFFFYLVAKGRNIIDKISVEDKIFYGLSTHKLDAAAINIGQELDVQLFSDFYDEHVKTLHQGQDVVLYGFSRGAATIFNFMATVYSKKTKDKKRVKAVVLEACFDSVQSLAHSLSLNWFCDLFPAYNKEGIEPIKVVHNFPKDVPILFVTSLEDEIVPHQCVSNMYNLLKKYGHKEVYLLELCNSRHTRYMMTSEKEKTAYFTAVHTFYKECGLSYILS